MDFMNVAKWVVLIIVVVAVLGVIVTEWLDPAVSVFGVAEDAYRAEPFVSALHGNQELESPVWLWATISAALFGSYQSLVLGIVFSSGVVVLGAVLVWWLIRQVVA